MTYKKLNLKLETRMVLVMESALRYLISPSKFLMMELSMKYIFVNLLVLEKVLMMILMLVQVREFFQSFAMV